MDAQRTHTLTRKPRPLNPPTLYPVSLLLLLLLLLPSPSEAPLAALPSPPSPTPPPNSARSAASAPATSALAAPSDATFLNEKFKKASPWEKAAPADAADVEVVRVS